jgi:hypothetical protein
MHNSQDSISKAFVCHVFGKDIHGSKKEIPVKARLTPLYDPV